MSMSMNVHVYGILIFGQIGINIFESNGNLRKVGFFSRVGGSCEIFRVGSFQNSEVMIKFDALIEVIEDISTFGIFMQEIGAVMVQAMNNDSLVWDAAELIVNFIIYEVESNSFQLVQVVLGEVSKINLLAWHVLCIIQPVPDSFQIYSQSDMLKLSNIISSSINFHPFISKLYNLHISFIMATIKEMDQNNWVCYKFGDASYYYGEVGLLDPFGVVHSKDNAELAADPKVKLVKHGFGIYIYEDPTGTVRYEGNWAKDHKNGKGVLKLKDGSVYEGQFKDGFYHDNGLLKWANGDIYDGRWKKGRMEGPGLFKRHDGLNLKGSFKNNFYIDVNTLRNPFMSQEQYQQLKKRRKQITKQYEKNQKIKNGYFERVKAEQLSKVATLIEKSTKNNRVALITASEQSGLSFAAVKQSLKTDVHLIDLRKSFKLEGQQKYNYLKEIEVITQKCIKNGGLLLLSLDDSQSVQQFQELFYPEVRQLYTPNGFNTAVWAPKDLNKAQIRNKIIGNSEVSDKFYFAVWSKVKLSQTLTDDFLREKIQKRFESVIPFIKIDMIFVENGKKQEKAQQAS